MAFYRGKVAKSQLLDKIIQLLTTPPSGSTEPLWKQVQSGTFANEGYILHSKGKRGTDDVYVRFINPTRADCLVMSMLEKYTPNGIAGLNGTIENESAKQNVHYYNGAYADTYPVHYFLSFDKDKIMLVLKGDSVVGTDWQQTLAWIGLPTRLDASDNSTAATFAVSRWAYQLTNQSAAWEGNAAECKVLRNRKQDVQGTYYMRNLNGFKTKGWGGHLLLSNIFLQDDENMEGVRSIMDGLHPIYQSTAAPDFRDGDEFSVGSKRYTVLLVYPEGTYSDSTNCFPAAWMAVEQIS